MLYDLVIRSEYDGDTSEYILTGSGLSVSELIVKVTNEEAISVYYHDIQDSEYANEIKYVDGNALVDYSYDKSGTNSYLKLTLVANQITLDFEYLGTEYECLYAPNGDTFIYTYNSTTKEYTFINNGGSE